MCEFCKNIGKLERVKRGYCRGTYKVKDRSSQIVFHSGQFDLYYYGEDCEEICVEDIIYCPICGRKLSEERLGKRGQREWIINLLSL